MERKLERHLKSDEQGPDNETISGTNGATRQMMKNINDTIRHYLRMIAVPVFGGAGLAIIIVGEINFFSPQVQFQTEPMASVGKFTASRGCFPCSLLTRVQVNGALSPELGWQC